MEIRSVSSRKWVKIFAIPSLLFLLGLPVTTYALGLGGIKLNSALSEILDAEIELVGATETDIEGLRIGLASRDAFLRAGIDRSSVINSMRFVVKKRPNGTYYVKVQSRRPIREPFLNFLMEMNWRNGRMLREYTLLLDPPGTVQKPQSTVVQTPTADPFRFRSYSFGETLPSRGFPGSTCGEKSVVLPVPGTPQGRQPARVQNPGSAGH